MDRVRSAWNSMMKSERYSRFTLQPAEDGERHVELSEGGGHAAAAAGPEDEGQAHGSPSFRPAPPRQGRQGVCYLALGTLLVFVIGYLLGYISHRKGEPLSVAPPTWDTAVRPEVTYADSEPAPELPLAWADIVQLLKQKLTGQSFDQRLRDYDLPRRSAGSADDTDLAVRIFDEFEGLEMDPWSDIHYVQLQKPDSTRPNRVIFGSEVMEPTGYLAYSATGKVQGKLVYGNYGRPEDLDVLQKAGVRLQDGILLLRSGKIPFAEQVDNAAKKGAAAVLIYPDIEDYKYQGDTPLFGHVHLGSGDPYTPGFPSFNHTQFPPTRSSGLPAIPAQTITAQMAYTLQQRIGGPNADAASGFKGGVDSVAYSLGGDENVTVEVNNALVNTQIRNVFGVVKGFTDPDLYVVLGAQRDAWGKGYARANVGTSVLLELAKAVSQMVKEDRFRPKRSLVFASWSAGEFGSVGATEWLEGYMSSIDKSVFSYISLDGVVMGRGSFVASASPLLYALVETTMKRVQSPLRSGTVYDMAGTSDWVAKVMKPMSMEDPAYPFVAFAGIPSVSFHFTSPNMESYPYYGTALDNVDHLDYETNYRTGEMAAVAAQFAGLMALQLVHDHLLSLDTNRYCGAINGAVVELEERISQLLLADQLKGGVSVSWLRRARGSLKRGVNSMSNSIQRSDLNNPSTCRAINNRLMKLEHCLLSPYVSPVETPFRHLLLGRGPHTLASLARTADMEQLRVQLAMATWNLQGCAYAMVRDIWRIHQDI